MSLRTTPPPAIQHQIHSLSFGHSPPDATTRLKMKMEEPMSTTNHGHHITTFGPPSPTVSLLRAPTPPAGAAPCPCAVATSCRSLYHLQPIPLSLTNLKVTPIIRRSPHLAMPYCHCRLSVFQSHAFNCPILLCYSAKRSLRRPALVCGFGIDTHQYRRIIWDLLSLVRVMTVRASTVDTCRSSQHQHHRSIRYSLLPCPALFLKRFKAE
ncbi:hypothetical protein NL676_008829 [Syzygium grande]|nr:hypothetical protein NL676_008829 [Syzygium grande]